MIDLLKTLYIYFDLDILKDDSYTFMFKEFAKQHVQMFVFVEDVSQKEDVCKLKNYPYMSDIVQGDDMEHAIQLSCQKRKQKPQHVRVICKQDRLASCIHTVDVLSISSIGYEGIKKLLWQRQHAKKQKKVILNTITLSCIIFYLLYFMTLCWLPTSLLKGDYANIIRLLPAVLLLISSTIGIRSKIYHPEVIVEIFDVFG